MGMAGSANAATAQAAATASILDSLQLQALTPLNFGTISAQNAGTVAISAAGAATCSSGLTCTGTQASASLKSSGNTGANITANGVGVQLDATGKLTVGEHKLPVSYGKVLRMGLDAVIIPNIDPYATNLQELLANHIDCSAVGQAINDALTQEFGFGGGAGTWTSACTAGLNFGSQQIYNQIAGIDASALEFDLTGTAKAVDTNSDHKADALQTVKWTGTLSYSGSPAPLAAATFTGTRM